MLEKNLGENLEELIDFFKNTKILSFLLSNIEHSEIENTINKISEIFPKIEKYLLGKEISELKVYNTSEGARHDLKNCYNVLKNQIIMYQEGYKELFDSYRISHIGKTIDMLTTSLTDEISRGNIAYDCIIISDLLNDFKMIPSSIISTRENKKMILKTCSDEFIDNATIDKFSASHLYRIIYNMCTNKKRLSENISIMIDCFNCVDEDSVCLNIYDDSGSIFPYENPYDACNFNSSKSRSSGIGLFAIKNLIENKLNGKLIIEKDAIYHPDKNYNGLKFGIIIPKDNFILYD